MQFTRLNDTTVYLSGSDADAGWAFIVCANVDSPDPAQLPPTPLPLSQALAYTSKDWAGSLVYLAAQAGAVRASPAAATAAIAALLNTTFGEQGALIFLPSGALIAEAPAKLVTRIGSTLQLVALSKRNGKVTPKSFFDVVLTGIPGVSAVFNPGCVLSVPDEATEGHILLTANASSTPVVTLAGPSQPSQTPPRTPNATLHFEGSALGAFRFDVEIAQRSLIDDLNMGFQLVIPNPVQTGAGSGADAVPFLAAYLPLAERGSASLFVVFTGQVNVMNPNNLLAQAAQTAFYFTGQSITGADSVETVLRSFYRSNYGKPVSLVPAAAGAMLPALVVNPGRQKTILQNGFRFSPQGDFQVRVEGTEAGEPAAILCGQSGTETVSFLAGTADAPAGQLIRFRSGMPANAPDFPLAPVSPVGPPIDPKAELMDDQYLTSWVSFLAPSGMAGAGGHYAAAPKGAELFGADAGTGATGALGPKDPGVSLPPDASVAFPMPPLAGFVAGDSVQDMSSAELDLLLQQIVAPTRKSRITAAQSSGAVRRSASPRHTLMPSAARDAAELTSTTTPTGFMTRYDSGGAWKQLLLGQVMADGTVTRQMGFTGLDEALQAAFQTNDQFLVIANNAHLGPFTDPGAQDPPDPPPHAFMPPATVDIADTPYFFNRIDIGQWSFTARPGVGNAYGSYRDVMIVKGLRGRILDVEDDAVQDASLLKSPDKWTMKEVFATPVPGDASQLIPLSDWLVTYCLEAYRKRDNPYFAKFARIITDPDWTGVLILKAGIAKVPEDIQGILAGVEDLSDFYAHHIGIDIGQINAADPGQLQQKETTSMFGLVYYVDPRYDDSLPPHTIPPLDLAAPQDFTLLTLKALFENSAIRKFESLAQMVLNRLFGAGVREMVDVLPEGPQINRNNAVLLEGGVQRNGDATLYSLASTWPNQFSLANNILTSVEIDTAEMSTRDSGATSGASVSWIGMTGFMNFAIVPENKDEGLPAFDVFSYGPEADARDALRQGLNFANLGLQITTPSGPADPGDAPAPVLVMVEAEMSFNSSTSHARQKSLYRSFQMELLGLVSAMASGEAKADPASLGYLPAVTQYNLRGVGSGGWHGLNFKLNLGTPGALAGKVNLDSNLMAAWADDSGATPGDATLKASVGIQLPGAGGGGELFSLQTVMKLSVGMVQLFYSPASKDHPDEQPGGFLLLINQIALKFFGLLKVPSSGNTAFFLFGDPRAGESTGLGWFAVYNKAKEEAKKAAAKAELLEHQGDGDV
ncbi:hypothetical protein [Hoeflea marina]|uniref:hypothetical protein n=1 Tax=Hoeflea marina TaxID=274592 RepID=UPI000D71735D|nr:hypothetical protein [Hoeflea marina]